MFDDGLDIFFVFIMSICSALLVFIVFMLAFEASDSKQAERVKAICTEVGGKVVEDVCIKNGDIVSIP